MFEDQMVANVRQGARADHSPPLGRASAILRAVVAGAAFHLAFEMPFLSALVLPGTYLLVTLSRVSSNREAFWTGFLSGMLIFALQLAWFWRIFGPASFCLWAILSAFIGFFELGLRVWRSRYGTGYLWLAAPVLWTGLEYFRSELYFLRFSWLTLGSAFSGETGLLPVGTLGVYGVGFTICLVAGIAHQLRTPFRVIFLIGSLLVTTFLSRIAPALQAPQSASTVQVAGIQLEFPPDLKVPDYLDRLIENHPRTDLLLLSEYTFDGPVPLRVREWCRNHRKYLIAGGKSDTDRPGEFYNTAFVVGPNGEIVFEQAKSVPIQFFKDGLPALNQKVWDSPWGPIAICICYDMSYRSVLDRFMRKGARALIVPFMDITEWGEHQHRLHARVGPIRAREYKIPLFRVGSSGISQLIDPRGNVLASSGFPGQEEMLGGEMTLGGPARLPLDSWLAPFCSVATGAFLLFSLARRSRSKL